MGKDQNVDDRFKKFGTVSFTETTKVNDFINYLTEGKVAGTRCSDCRTRFFPPRADCCHCLAGNMEWFEIKEPGTLLTYSKLQFGPMGFENDLPYSIALLDYGDFKIFGRISDRVSEEDIRPGIKMKPVPNTLPGGQLNYVFEPV